MMTVARSARGVAPGLTNGDEGAAAVGAAGLQELEARAADRASANIATGTAATATLSSSVLFAARGGIG